jgi:hypothetical protein
MPASVIAATTPQPEPKPGLQLTWKFLSGQDYTVIVDEGALTTLYGNPDRGLGGDILGWAFDTTDGRKVTVYKPNVMVFESRNVLITPRKLVSHG